MSIQNPRNENVNEDSAESIDVSYQEWGNGKIVSHWDEGSWIMYDPEADTVDLSDMR